MKNLTVSIRDDTYRRLEHLASATKVNTVGSLLSRLLDHTDQGIYRRQSWERGWLAFMFGGEAVDQAEAVMWEKSDQPRDANGDLFQKLTVPLAIDGLSESVPTDPPLASRPMLKDTGRGFQPRA